MSGGTTPPDPSRSRTADGTGFCADHRESGSVPMWQANRELSGIGAAGGLERESTTAGPYHQTRQHSVALLVSGSGPGDGAQRSRMAEQVPPSDDAPGTKDRQGRDGAQTGGSDVLDDAQGMELRAVEKVRFARGTTRTRRWCEVEHRVID